MRVGGKRPNTEQESFAGQAVAAWGFRCWQAMAE
jgi:hypothetical protein